MRSDCGLCVQIQDGSQVLELVGSFVIGILTRTADIVDELFLVIVIIGIICSAALVMLRYLSRCRDGGE